MEKILKEIDRAIVNDRVSAAHARLDREYLEADRLERRMKRLETLKEEVEAYFK